MKNFIIHPVSFFENVRDKEVNIKLPILILFLTGIMEGVMEIFVIQGITFSDILLGKFPIVRFLWLELIANLSFYVIIALQTILFPIIIKKLGGDGGSRKHSFYILGLSALPILIQSTLHFFFPGTIWWHYFEDITFLYILGYKFINLFNVWSIALLIIGFAKVYNVSYKKSSILYLQFIIKLIPLFILQIIIG